MGSPFRCCVRYCTTTRSDDCNVILHSFPNPDKEEDRFRSWVYSIGGDILVLDNQFVFKNRKICHKHFESKYHTRSSRLSANAVPTLHLKGIPCKRPLSDVTNVTSYNPIFAQPSTSTAGPLHSGEPISIKTSELEKLAEADLGKPVKTSGVKHISLKQAAAMTKNVPNLANLQKTIKKLQQKKESYATRLKRALRLSENTTFQKCLQKFSTLAALFTVMQFREISKGKMGRRFTKDEKSWLSVCTNRAQKHIDGSVKYLFYHLLSL
ncbi:uncharacterized protein LOC135116740 [Helicoverpa armigera]|uniref:uncharacterized protein LOC135116740 n=1 Tax=Helicoverpa armigera TaxID=29058 RepID=UPI003082CC0D